MKRPAAIHISIPEPCTEAWDEMTPAPGGKHCAHCQKTVVDFTRITDSALLHYVQLNGLGCGRLTNTQLDRLITLPEEPRRKWWPQVMLGIGLFLGIPKDAISQRQNELVPAIAPVDHVTKDPIDSAPAKDLLSIDTTKRIRISGELVDQQGPVINATISVIDETGKYLGSALTNFDGEFVISPIPFSYVGRTIEIEAKYLNSVERMPLRLQTLNSNIRMKMTTRMYESHTVGVVITVKKPWHHHFFQRKWRKLKYALHSK